MWVSPILCRYVRAYSSYSKVLQTVLENDTLPLLGLRAEVLE